MAWSGIRRQVQIIQHFLQLLIVDSFSLHFLLSKFFFFFFTAKFETDESFGYLIRKAFLGSCVGSLYSLERCAIVQFV